MFPYNYLFSHLQRVTFPFRGGGMRQLLGHLPPMKD